ncbi:MAG TPA: hypothetical protein VGR26_03510 [Acidimicrobiales bacterium]|nr:hypothetical protein [Acidimicrobiales bacterium]
MLKELKTEHSERLVTFGASAAAVLGKHRERQQAEAAFGRRAGLERRPTFRRPHYSVMLPDLAADVERLTSGENEQRLNPHFQCEEAA